MQFKCSPSLSKLKDEISELMRPPPCEDDECGIGQTVMMSGSGTSIYAITKNIGVKEKGDLTSHINSFISSHKGLKYYETNFITKENSAESWY